MSTKKKLLLGAAGTAAAGGAGLDVDEVFSTTVYDGTSGSSLSINNGIDLTEGGLVWTKERSSGGGGHRLFSTDASGNHSGLLVSSSTAAAGTGYQPTYFTFNNNGYTTTNTVGDSKVNGNDYVSWTFRKSPMFDVQTWTGNGATTQISHSLGSTPGFWVFKRTDTTAPWYAGHYDGTTTRYLQLNTSSDQSTSPHLAWGDFPNNSTVIPPTSTYVTFSGYLNVSGASFVGYFWASHANDGSATGFGPDGVSPVISCGSFTTSSSSATNVEINTGFEPQWLLLKSTSIGGPWNIVDNMRGFTVDGTSPRLSADVSNSEAEGSSNRVNIRSNGFSASSAQYDTNTNMIYMAIRRGPLAAPTDATKVFHVQQQSSGDTYSVGFPTDVAILARTGGYSINSMVGARLTSGKYLVTSATDAEGSSGNTFIWDLQNSFDQNYSNTPEWVGWHWKRAPSYFDVVGFSGTGSARDLSHNLGVVPEMYWIKARDESRGWIVYVNIGGTYKELSLNGTGAAGTASSIGGDPTASVIKLGTTYNENRSGYNYIAYLFASVPNVSKIGEYTGNGSSQNIDCGFSSGARFVLIKRTDASQHWILFDSTRGIVSGNDPSLKLSDTEAEYSGADDIDPHSSGFTINNDVSNGYQLSTSGASYIFYAIA